MSTSLRRWISSACVILGVSGCSDNLPITLASEAVCSDPRSAPVLALRDSVILAESDSIYLGNPAATFTLDERGQYFIPDRGNNRILQFSASGALVRTFGRRGSGPGEFGGLGNAIMVARGRVWQNDYTRNRISVFDTTGTFMRTVHHQGRLSGLKGAGGTAWAGLLVGSRMPGVAGFDTEQPPDSLLASMISLPDAYARFPMLSYWDHTSVLDGGETLLVAFGGVEYLVRYERSGTPIDTVWVPACRRQGSPEEIVAQAFRAMARTAEEQARVQDMQLKISGLLGSWRLSDGRILVWYQDPRNGPGGTFLSRAYLSVLSPDLRRACVDAELSGPGSDKAILSVHNDQVHLLDQVILPGESRNSVQSVIRRYSVVTDDCLWVGTGAPWPHAGVR